MLWDVDESKVIKVDRLPPLIEVEVKNYGVPYVFPVTPMLRHKPEVWDGKGECPF